MTEKVPSCSTTASVSGLIPLVPAPSVNPPWISNWFPSISPPALNAEKFVTASSTWISVRLKWSKYVPKSEAL